MKRSVALIGGFLLAVIVSACGGGSSGTDTRPLVVSFSSFSGESALSWMAKANDNALYAPVFDHLVITDPQTRELKPGIALSWESTPDGKTWTVKLRPGVPFSDPQYGNLTSEDVAYQIERMKGKDAAGSDAPYFKVASTSTPDEQTVKVTFPSPTWEFPYHLTEDAGYLHIQPKAYIEKVGDKKAALEPIGTGPYKQVSYSPGVEHVYEAVATYPGAKPEFKKMTIKVIADPAAQLNGVRAGEIDIALTSGDMLDQAKSAGLKIKTVDSSSQEFMALPGMARPGSPSYDPSLPWVGDDNDPQSAAKALKVREALNLAVNRKALIDGLWNGAANRKTFNYNYFPWQAGYKDSWALPEYDPAKAKKLLAEAGYPDGFTFPVASTAMSTAPDGPDVTAAINQDLKRIGINVKSTDVAYASLSPKFLNRTLDQAWIYGSFVRPEPSMMWSIMSSTKGAAAILVERPQFERQLDVIETELDAEKRAQLISDLGQSLYDYKPAIMIGTKAVTWVLSDRVGEWPAMPGASAMNLSQVTRSN